MCTLSSLIRTSVTNSYIIKGFFKLRKTALIKKNIIQSQRVIIPRRVREHTSSLHCSLSGTEWCSCHGERRPSAAVHLEREYPMGSVSFPSREHTKTHNIFFLLFFKAASKQDISIANCVIRLSTKKTKVTAYYIFILSSNFSCHYF